MTWNRRRVLKAGTALAGVSAAGLLVGTARGQAVAGSQDAASVSNAAREHGAEHVVEARKRIALLNLHTDERLEIEYFRDGAYLPQALSAIEVLLRDFRTGERHAIDP